MRKTLKCNNCKTSMPIDRKEEKGIVVYKCSKCGATRKLDYGCLSGVF